MAELDARSSSRGPATPRSLFQWLLLAVKHGYAAGVPAAREFLMTEQGRRKFMKPLYEELAKTPEGRARVAPSTAARGRATTRSPSRRSIRS